MKKQSFVRYFEDSKLDTYRMVFRIKNFKTNKILSICPVNNNNNNSSNSNSNRLNKRGLIGQKGSLSGGKDFSPSSRCSSNNKNITLLKLNDNDGNGNSVCYNYNRQGATTPNNSSAISKKYTFKKQIATHHKKPAVIDIDINLICWKIHGIDRILHEKNLL
jgi:hypothetical protein